MNQLKSVFLALTILCSPLVHADEVLFDWNFEDGVIPFIDVKMAEATISDDQLNVRVLGNDVALYLPEVEKGPVIIKARMRSGDGAFGRAEIFWRSNQNEQWNQNNVSMYSLQHDGEWHDYEFPVPIPMGDSAFIRFDLGWKPGLFEIDSLQVVYDDYSAETQTMIDSLPESLKIKSDSLSLEYRGQDQVILVQDNRLPQSSSSVWTMDVSDQQAAIIKAEKIDDQSITFTLWDEAQETSYISHFRLKEVGVLCVDLDSEDKDQYFWSARSWPPTLERSFEQGGIVFCDRSSGTLIPEDETLFYANKDLTIFGNTTCSDLPWLGLYDQANGDGVMMLAETPDDADFALKTNEKGLIRPQIRWMQSMDSFRYKREFSYRFVADGGYVEMANFYRQYVKEQGRFLTKTERIEQNPDVAKLMGAALVWGSSNVKDFMLEARTEGMLHAILLNAHHGTNDPADTKWLTAHGYLAGEYDSFSDIQDGPTGQQSDNVEETAFHARPGLGPKGGWVDVDGTTYADRSTAFGLRALKSYVPNHLEKWGYNSHFIDVSMAINLQEDWHPEHTFDRRQDKVYRREIFDYLRHDLDVVMGTEHGNDWGIDLVDFWEGAIGGPFYWDQQGSWNAGQLLRPSNKDDYSETYLTYGNGYGTSIPLWQLIYDDAVFSSWYWGDTAGFHYAVAPEISRRKDLFTILYAGNPLLWRDNVGYNWIENKDRFMETYHQTAHVNKALALHQMTNHEFLSEDRSLQRTSFSDGSQVVVNFSEQPVEYNDQIIAPTGYVVSGPEITQEKVIEDGVTKTRILTDDYIQLESPLRETVNSINYEGHFRGFKMPEGHWQFVLSPERLFSFDVESLTGWSADSTIALYELDEVGEKKRVVAFDQTGSLIRFMTGKNSKYFGLYPEDPMESVLTYPVSGEIATDQQVYLSSSTKHSEIRYTLDGSEVSETSPIYYGSLHLSASATLRAQAFDGSQKVGKEQSTEYFVYHKMAETPIMMSGMTPEFRRFNLQEANQLRIILTMGDDSPWNDQADLGDPQFITATGEKIRLSSLEPVSMEMTYGSMEKDSRKNTPLTINGKKFDHGLALYSRAELVYDIDPDWVEFETWAGIDDQASGHPKYPGSVQFYFHSLYTE